MKKLSLDLYCPADNQPQIKHLGCDFSQDFTTPKFQLVLTHVMCSSVLTIAYGDPSSVPSCQRLSCQVLKLMVQKNTSLLCLLYDVCQPTYCSLYPTSNKTRQTKVYKPNPSLLQMVSGTALQATASNKFFSYLSWYANIQYTVIRITSHPQTAPSFIAS